MSDQPACKPGDVVRLLSGGPKMTVERIHSSGDTATCIWFDVNHKLCRDSFGLYLITFAEETNERR